MATAEIYYPTDFALEFIPLQPGLGWGEAFDEALQGLADHGFVMAIGTHRQFAGDVGEMAKQEHILEFCWNDPGRMGTVERLVKWLQKERVMVGIYAVRDWKPGDQIDFAALTNAQPETLQQVAYAWAGPEKNDDGELTGDITTAYRVGEAGQQLVRERQLDETEKYRLGLPLGRLVLAVTTEVYGADPQTITLEAWESNASANRLYELLGFSVTHRGELEARPTLKPIGTVINGQTVYYNPKKNRNEVLDRRLEQRLMRPAASAQA